MSYIKNDIYVLKTLTKKLEVIYSFPHDGNSFDLMLYAKFVITRLFFVGPMILGMICHLYQSILKGHIFELVSAIYYINLCVMYYSANTIVFIKGKEILRFLKSLSEMRKEHLQNYESTVVNMEKLTKIVYYSVIFVQVALTLESYMRDNYCHNRELVNEPHYVCGTLTPLWYPLKKKYPLLKPICALYSFGVGFTQIPTMASSASLYLGSVEFIELKMEYLIGRLKKMDLGKKNKEEVERELKSCIKYYIEITSLVKEMNESIGYIFAPTHNAYNNILMGILGYLSIKLGSIPNAFQLILWLVVQWISCHSGQKLEDSSLLLREELFNLSWFDIDPSLRSTFRLFHAHVSLTFHLKIQPIMNMNMEQFFSILKGAYSFLMFLLKM